MQIQVYPGRGSAVQALEKGLRDLLDVSQHVESVFKVRANCLLAVPVVLFGKLLRLLLLRG